MSAAKARQNSSEKTQFLGINEQFKEEFNDAGTSALVFQQPVNNLTPLLSMLRGEVICPPVLLVCDAMTLSSSLYNDKLQVF